MTPFILPLSHPHNLQVRLDHVPLTIPSHIRTRQESKRHEPIESEISQLGKFLGLGTVLEKQTDLEDDEKNSRSHADSQLISFFPFRPLRPVDIQVID